MTRFRPAIAADEPAWQALVGRCSAGDFLHDWAWAEVAAFDGQPQRRFVLEEDGELVALVAAQERRLPLGRAFWYVPHGPVLDYADPRAGEWLRALTIGLREVGRSSRVIAAKLEPRIEADAPEAALFARLRPDPRPVQVGQTRIVELTDDEALLASFDKDTRYAVRRSQREGVEVRVLTDASDTAPIDALHGLVLETQRRAGFPLPPLARYRIAWHALGGAGRASILEARRDDELLASGMLVVEGERSFYLFSGSRREDAGEPKHYASYLLQWEMMRRARDLGSRLHDLWGIAPTGAGPEHAWHGVGLFKKGFGGREVRWAGTWDVVIDPTLYRLRAAIAMARSVIPGGPR
ncbi:MAG TPA: peptidoglycan bridge formation glycyltransferase FemA/FemB family protein [Candidatus Limnocylindria bacterium]|nr:peptidoglycan bridge formation glycyltransferase FemA/FemB family protein [Candidatus Limnocylindria bacterium]